MEILVMYSYEMCILWVPYTLTYIYYSTCTASLLFSFIWSLDSSPQLSLSGFLLQGALKTEGYERGAPENGYSGNR